MGVRQEIERRLNEKEEEFMAIKKNQSKALDSMQAALEAESKGKVEALRMKKKLDAQVKVDEETSLKAMAQDQKVAAGRKAGAMQNALEEARTLLEQADRARRCLEQELCDSNETLADLTNTNQALAAAKRKLENEFGALNGDLDEMCNEAKLSEEKSARAM